MWVECVHRLCCWFHLECRHDNRSGIWNKKNATIINLDIPNPLVTISGNIAKFWFNQIAEIVRSSSPFLLPPIFHKLSLCSDSHILGDGYISTKHTNQLFVKFQFIVGYLLWLVQ